MLLFLLLTYNSSWLIKIMESFWPILKIILGVAFLLCCLVLPFLLFFLGVSKKKLGLYIQQIKKSGKITKDLGSMTVAFDLFLIAHVFDSIPDKNKYPEYYANKQTKALIEHITTLSKITKPIAITTALVTATLIVLLNIYEG